MRTKKGREVGREGETERDLEQSHASREQADISKMFF